MFDNLVNIHDLNGAVRKGPARVLHALSRLFSGRRQSVQTAWAVTAGPPISCWDIPLVQARWNRLVSGDPEVDTCSYLSQRYLPSRRCLNGLSLGCGTGSRELRWVQTGVFESLHAYDLSPTRIAAAQEEAVRRGVDGVVDFRVGDILELGLPRERYDVVLAEGALHHFSPLKEVLLRVEQGLKPDGYLMINEFVGPTRFQWTERQVEAINAALSLLPKRYRTLFGTDSAKPPVFRPSRLRMILSDPSEAVESSQIQPLLRELFEVVEVKPYGGALLQMLLHGIAHHFITPDPEAARWLSLLFEIEDELMRAGELESDYLVAVCRKRS